MVVYGKRSALNLRAEQLEAIITTGFPDVISKQAISEYNLQSMIVTLQSSNMSALSVFNEEFKGFDPFVSNEDIYFSIAYKIETKYRKGCFGLCDCK